MKYFISRPEIPIVWLDTHAINEMLFARLKPSNDPRNILVRRIYDDIVRLHRAGRIFSFESDQLSELEVRNELVETGTSVLTQISQGVRTHAGHPRRMQFQIAAKAYHEKAQQVEIEWRTAFLAGNPLPRKQSDRFFIRARIAPTAEELQRRVKSNKEIASHWEAMRLDLVKSPAKERERRASQMSLELATGQKVFVDALAAAAARRDLGITPTTDEYLAELETLGTPASLWKRHTGSVDVEDIIKFYGSDYYTGSPYIEISSELCAHKVIAGEPIKQGDPQDIENIAAFLPYVSMMVLDRSMINTVRSLKIDLRYNTRVMTLSDLGRELERIDAQS